MLTANQPRFERSLQRIAETRRRQDERIRIAFDEPRRERPPRLAAPYKNLFYDSRPERLPGPRVIPEGQDKRVGKVQ